jgi:hypothetical protein
MRKTLKLILGIFKEYSQFTFANALTITTLSTLPEVARFCAALKS